ncbi:MAG: ComEC/Rec2 family competence protein [Solirubrobacterales bacterium]|nr:ComEC/Rec2 family competence protein [Solirubrobacterales bacterium]
MSLAGVASGLLIAPTLAAPAGWEVVCLASALALGWMSRSILDPRAPPGPGVALTWLVCLAALAALAGLGIGAIRLAAIERGALQAPEGSEAHVSGFVAGFPKRSLGDVRVPLETDDGRILAVVPEPVGDLTVGAEVRAVGEIVAPEEGFARSQVERAGAVAELRAPELVPTGGARGGLDGVLDAARSRAERALGAGMSEEQSSLARGFVLGQDDAVDPATREAFARAGLAHLLAVSGQNVMLLALLGGVVFALFGAGLRMRLTLTLLLIAVYVPIAGSGPSIERAGVMGAAAILATLAGRPSERAYPLLLAAVVTLLIDPRAGTDVGWQLSFAAVAGIMLWARPIGDLLAARLPRHIPDRLAAPLADGAALTIAATVATAPLIAHVFERVSLASLPANVAVLPAVAPVMWVGMAMSMLAQLPPWLIAAGPLHLDPIAWLGWIEGGLIDYVVRVAETSAAPSWAVAPVGLPGVLPPLLAGIAVATGLSVLLAALGRRRGLGAVRSVSLGVAVALLLALLPAALGTGPGAPRGPARGELQITEIDVGQGDATLLRTANGPPVLVDGGPPGAAAAEGLTELGVERFGAVVVTHDELDHAGGLATVLDRFEVGELVHAQPAPELQAMARGAGIPIERVAAGSALRFGRLRLDVLWPPRERFADPSPERNADAVVMLARFRGWSALLSADAEQELTHLDPGPLDLLKVAHHGSDDAGLGSLLERSLPRLALIGVGADNGYGHPTAATLTTLAEHGVCTLRTDLDGTSGVFVGPEGMRAWSERGPPGCSG